MAERIMHGGTDMQGTNLPNGVTIWYEPTDPDHMVIEYPSGERLQPSRTERKRLTHITGELQEVYEDLLKRAGGDTYDSPTPVKLLLKLDDILMDLGAYGRRQMVCNQ